METGREEKEVSSKLERRGEPRGDDGGKRERTISMIRHENVDDLEDEEPDRLDRRLHLDVVEDPENEKGKKGSAVRNKPRTSREGGREDGLTPDRLEKSLLFRMWAELREHTTLGELELGRRCRRACRSRSW